MAESINRDIATSISAAVKADTITSAGAIANAMTVVDSTGALPLSGSSAGDRAFVTDSNYYYIHNGSGWFQIALINTTPTFTSIVDSDGTTVASGVEFALSGAGANTVLTLTATDAEGITVVYNVTSDVGFDSLATFSYSGNVVTITPRSEDSAVTASGTLTFTASDGVNIGSAVRTFTLTFAPPVHTGKNALLLKADNTAPTAPTDSSSNSLSITTVGTQTEAFTAQHPFGMGSSYYFNGSNSRINSNANNRWDITTGDFTLEGWYYNRGDTGVIIHSAYWSNGNNRGYYLRNSGQQLQLKASQGAWNSFPNVLALSYFFPTYEWTHFSINRISGVIYTYRNGVLFNTTNYSASLNQTGGSSGNRACVIGARYSDGTYSQYNEAYMRDIIVDTGTAIRTGEFTPPAGMTGVDDQVTLTSSCKAYLLKSNNRTWNVDHGPNALGYTFYNMGTGTNYAPPSGDYKNWSKTEKGGSYYFDGTTSPYFKVDSNAALALGTGDFTIECWFKPRAINKYHSLLDSRTTDNQAVPLIWLHTSNYFYYYVNNASRIASNTYVRKNVWYHVMVTRSNNVTRMFVNGHYEGQWADTTNYVQGGDWHIGQRFESQSTGNAAHGYLKDFRVKNVASATDNNDITPPTKRLTSDSNTILLVAGDTTGKIFDVVSGHNNTDGTLINGDATASTAQTKFADASMTFDGTGDYLSVNDSTNLDFSNSIAGGAAPYTLETWAYPTTVAGSTTWRTICNNGASGVYAPMYLSMQGDKLHWFASHNGSSYAIDTRTDLGASGIHTMSANTWHHLAVTWNHSVYSFFVDGVYKASVEKSGYPMDPTRDLGVGARDDGNEPFTGYLEDFRITKRLSRYPFIPHSVTHTSDSNTVLLVAHAATIVDGSSNSRTITSNSAPTVSSFSPHINMKSIYFDGSDDFITTAASNDWGFGTGAYTIEFWYRGTDTDGDVISAFDPSSPYAGWSVRITNGLVYYYVHNGSSGTAYTQVGGTRVVNDGYWHHIALTSENGSSTVICYINGTRVGSSTMSNLHPSTTGYALRVGAATNASSTHWRPTAGYVSNVRLSNVVRYSGNFTPPTEALTG